MFTTGTSFTLSLVLLVRVRLLKVYSLCMFNIIELWSNVALDAFMVTGFTVISTVVVILVHSFVAVMCRVVLPMLTPLMVA